MNSFLFLFIIMASVLNAAMEHDDLLILKTLDGRRCSVKFLSEMASGASPISLEAKVLLRCSDQTAGEYIDKSIPVEWAFSPLGNSVFLSHPNETWNCNQLLVYPEFPESLCSKLSMRLGEILFF